MTKVPGVDAVAERALRKAPDERYQSAAAFADDLEACLAGKPPTVRRDRWRLRWLFIALSVLAACGLFAAYLFWPNPPVPSFNNTMSMHFVRITRGTHLIPASAGGAYSISIDHDFYLSASDVTQFQYMGVVGPNPSDVRFLDYGAPVENLTRAQAIEFCRILSSRDRRVYRLPTVEEWKYGYYSGQVQLPSKTNIDTLGWASENSRHRPQLVRQKARDRWGLYDMLGNVRQWCSDPAHPDLSPVAMGTDYLTPGTDALDPAKLEIRVEASTRRPTIGFRVVCESYLQN
jgi:formylglycine-generating enzyme required for sulfatase activity